MNANRKIGLELQNGHDVGRDPRRMTGDELAALGHQRMGPLKALRLRCIDCSGGIGRRGAAAALVSCPAWPFRMGENPWRAPASDTASAAHDANLGRQKGVSRCRIMTKRMVVRTNCSEGPLLPVAADMRADETHTSAWCKIGGPRMTCNAIFQHATRVLAAPPSVINAMGGVR